MKLTRLFPILLLLLASCGGGQQQQQQPKADSTALVIKELNVNSPDCDQYVLISTTVGDITVKLYRDAPLHRKNFINLVMNGYYNGQSFYRVKPGQLIQTGDYESIENPAKPKIGSTDVDYTIPSEIDPANRWHKRGALAAASVNQGDYSSGAHFYIISGGRVTDDALQQAQNFVNKAMVERRYIELQLENNDEIRRLRDAGEKAELGRLAGRLKNEARAEFRGKEFSYTTAQRSDYKRDGGAPHLDPYYTVFGEVLSGIEIVDSISRVATNPVGRPNEHIIIKSMTILENYAQ